jgi:hypothetical protein
MFPGSKPEPWRNLGRLWNKGLLFLRKNDRIDPKTGKGVGAYAI